MVDVLRNGTIRRPHKKIHGSMDDSHKKIYRSMDDSYNGLLNCDVPFVFVRPLRESSLPFFERSCQFLELDVGVSNCVEVFFIFFYYENSYVGEENKNIYVGNENVNIKCYFIDFYYE